MALPIKPPRATGEYTHVYSKDPALDVKHESFDHARFVESGEQSFLPTVQGQKPTLFTLRRLGGREIERLNGVVARDGWRAACWDACQVAIESISDLPFEHVYAGAERVAPDEVLEQLRRIDDGGVIYELGNRILVGDREPKKS